MLKLLGVTIDSKLNFDSHVKNICKKANQKSRALIRIRKYMQCLYYVYFFLLSTHMDVSL